MIAYLIFLTDSRYVKRVEAATYSRLWEYILLVHFVSFLYYIQEVGVVAVRYAMSQESAARYAISKCEQSACTSIYI